MMIMFHVTVHNKVQGLGASSESSASWAGSTRLAIGLCNSPLLFSPTLEAPIPQEDSPLSLWQAVFFPEIPQHPPPRPTSQETSALTYPPQHTLLQFLILGLDCSLVPVLCAATCPAQGLTLPQNKTKRTTTKQCYTRALPWPKLGSSFTSPKMGYFYFPTSLF